MMGKEEEIARIARRLDKMVTKKSAEGAMDLLRELKAMPITLHLLQSTRVGMSVNALRKQSSDEEVIALAKSLIKSWKKLLDASDAKARERGRGMPLPTSSRDASEAPDPSRKRPELPRAPSTPRITTFPPVPVTCDAVRNKCREMLTAALQTDHDHVAIGADCERLSAQIEEYILWVGAVGLGFWWSQEAAWPGALWWLLDATAQLSRGHLPGWSPAWVVRLSHPRRAPGPAEGLILSACGA
ncbi:TCEA2 isoform 5 [Pan troglodytes]|uniref:TCEA2 isoform 5 n=1 Tax=Pan troglodytes TaxID=9598 RepID=A0A2J8KNB9_PANTR|nr:TCEA2 isoform 5 [Pan troglodytes]